MALLPPWIGKMEIDDAHRAARRKARHREERIFGVDASARSEAGFLQPTVDDGRPLSFHLEADEARARLGEGALHQEASAARSDLELDPLAGHERSDVDRVALRHMRRVLVAIRGRRRRLRHERRFCETESRCHGKRVARRILFPRKRAGIFLARGWLCGERMSWPRKIFELVRFAAAICLLFGCDPTTPYRYTALTPAARPIPWDGHAAKGGTVRIEGSLSKGTVFQKVLPQLHDTALNVPEMTAEGSISIAPIRGFEMGIRGAYSAYSWSQPSIDGTEPLPSHPVV